MHRVAGVNENFKEMECIKESATDEHIYASITEMNGSQHRESACAQNCVDPLPHNEKPSIEIYPGVSRTAPNPYSYGNTLEYEVPTTANCMNPQQTGPKPSFVPSPNSSGDPCDVLTYEQVDRRVVEVTLALPHSASDEYVHMRHDTNSCNEMDNNDSVVDLSADYGNNIAMVTSIPVPKDDDYVEVKWAD